MSIIEVKATRSQEAQAPQGRERFESKNAERSSQMPFYLGAGIGALMLYLKSSLVPWAEASEAPEHGLNNPHTPMPTSEDVLTAEMANFIKPIPEDYIPPKQMPKMLQHPTLHSWDQYGLNPYAPHYNLDSVDLRYRPLAENPMMRSGSAVNFAVLSQNDNGFRSTGNHHLVAANSPARVVQKRHPRNQRLR
jgi:hypothetical protein